MQTTDRMREIARAIKDGSARPAEVLELAQLVLAGRASGTAAAQRLYEAIVRHTGAELSSDICEQIMREAMEELPEQKIPLTDAEMLATGLIAMSEMLYALGQTVPTEGGRLNPILRPHNRLDDELKRRGIL